MISCFSICCINGLLLLSEPNLGFALFSRPLCKVSESAESEHVVVVLQAEVVVQTRVPGRKYQILAYGLLRVVELDRAAPSEFPSIAG